MYATNLLRFPILLVGYFLLLYSLKSVDVRIVKSCRGSTNRFKDGNAPDLGIGIVTKFNAFFQYQCTFPPSSIFSAPPNSLSTHLRVVPIPTPPAVLALFGFLIDRFSTRPMPSRTPYNPMSGSQYAKKSLLRLLGRPYRIVTLSNPSPNLMPAASSPGTISA